MLTLAPPLCQVRQVWVERSCPTTAAEQVGSNLSSGEAIDGFAVQPEPSRDRSNCEPLSQQLVDFGVPSLGPLFQFSSDYGKHPHREAFQRISQVVHQVPPICHLECVGRTPPGSTGVDAIPVTADNFGTRMLAEPIDERISRRIFQ